MCVYIEQASLCTAAPETRTNSGHSILAGAKTLRKLYPTSKEIVEQMCWIMTWKVLLQQKTTKRVQVATQSSKSSFKQFC